MLSAPDFDFLTSESVEKFMPAFIKARASMGAVIKDSANPHLKSKYADLGAVTDVVEPALLSQDITIVQVPFSKDGRTGVVTTLWHKSGEWMRCVLGLTPVKVDPQADGSAITYARRYSLMVLCNVIPEDDDGNAASGRVQQDARDRSAPRDDRQHGTARMSSAKAKEEGWWELFTGEIDACRTPAEVSAWAHKRAGDIKTMPKKWVGELGEYRAKRLAQLVPPLSYPDDDFPPDWETWVSRMGIAINQAPDAATVDAILFVNVEAATKLKANMPDRLKDLRDAADAAKNRLADAADQRRAA